MLKEQVTIKEYNSNLNRNFKPTYLNTHFHIQKVIVRQWIFKIRMKKKFLFHIFHIIKVINSCAYLYNSKLRNKMNNIYLQKFYDEL